MTPELIFCCGGNKRFVDIAMRYGFAYGARIPETIYHPLVFADQEYQNPDRAGYMAALQKHRPRLATVLDWEREDQFGEVMDWAKEASAHIDELIIIPKIPGSIPRLPREIQGKKVRLGYSVPTTHGGTPVPVYEYSGWDIHLLGGDPAEQVNLWQMPALNVVSADTNFHQKQANKRSQFFAPNGGIYGAKNRHWPQLHEVGDECAIDVPYRAFSLSVINIFNAWQRLPGVIRYGLEADIPEIVKIMRFFNNELGGVFYPGLREKIANSDVFVALMAGRVVGFVRWHARRDGRNTIYEIAVHPQWQNIGIGKALFNAVPKPVQLKCTVDNSKANRFYEAVGMICARRESGKKRELNIWELEGL